MTEHLTERIIELYRLRQVDPAEQQNTDAHLAVCETCLKRVADSKHSALAFNSLTEALLPSVAEEDFHPSKRELKRYVAGTADEADRTICESHIEVCDPCNEELQLLKAAQAARNLPEKIPANAPGKGRHWQGWTLFTPARAAVMATVVILLVLVVVQLQKRQSSVQSADETRLAAGTTPTASLQPSPPASPTEIATPGTPTEPNAANESALVRLRDGEREILLDGKGKLKGLEDLDEPVQRMVGAALRSETLTKPGELNDLSSPPIKFLGEQPKEIALQLVGPLGKVVTEARPTLRWREISGATSYVVSIFDDNFNLLTKSPPLTKPVWTLNVPLPRGHSYSWEVTAIIDGKEITAPVAPAPRAQFRILESDKLLTLSRLKTQRPVSHLALGLMYARCGLISDAEHEFQELVNDNSDSSAAKKLLRTVQSWQTH